MSFKERETRETNEKQALVLATLDVEYNANIKFYETFAPTLTINY